jgi:surface antigen
LVLCIKIEEEKMQFKWMRYLMTGAIMMQTSACQDREAREVAGGLVGGGGGAIVGAQIGAGTGQVVAAAAGAVLGALMGGKIGQSIHESDHAYADAAAQRALRTGQPAHWCNPSTGHRGTINVGPQYRDKAACYRDYTQKIYIDGKEEMARGTACKQPDGAWVICNEW